ncbi:MAG: hypothetical protein ACXV5H_07225 [Halobacteriota archaeon]
MFFSRKQVRHSWISTPIPPSQDNVKRKDPEQRGHFECNPLKVASHKVIGGTISGAGAAIRDVATRRFINHLFGLLYPNSYGICLAARNTEL